MTKAKPAEIVAYESHAQRAGEAAGRLAMVELQQFCFGEGDGSGVPYSD
jgi:hypothetical protein